MFCSYSTFRTIQYIADKILKLLYILVVLTLISLWIALSVDAVHQLQDNQDNKPIRMDSSSFSSSLASSSSPSTLRDSATTIGLASTIALRASEIIFKRLYLLIIFNLILEIFIAVTSIIATLVRSNKVFTCSLMLLLVIWLVEQYRITDFYHQFGQIDMPNSRMIIATHTVHFIAILFGLSTIITTNTNQQNNSLGSAKRHSLPNNRVSVVDFANLDSSGNTNANNNNNNNNQFIPNSNFDNQNNWMRSTFTKCRSDRNNEPGTVSQNAQNQLQSQPLRQHQPQHSQQALKQISVEQ